jgi:hypothetical protein
MSTSQTGPPGRASSWLQDESPRLIALIWVARLDPGVPERRRHVSLPSERADECALERLADLLAVAFGQRSDPAVDGFQNPSVQEREQCHADALGRSATQVGELIGVGEQLSPTFERRLNNRFDTSATAPRR